MQFKIKNQGCEITHPYGDFIYGNGIQEYLRKYKRKDIEGKNILYLQYFYANPWTVVTDCEVTPDCEVFDTEHFNMLREMGAYRCEYTERDYDSFMPVCIFSDDVEKYIPNKNVWWYDMATDKSWNLSGNDPYLDFDEPNDCIMTPLMTIMMGSGYADNFVMSDGSFSYVPVLMDIEGTDDVIYGISLCWHNT